MNKEEAIKYGTEWLKDEYLDARDGAFIEIALEALKRESCEDAINREDALMCLTGEIKDTDTIETIIARSARRIRKLPPVNPTKTGHWIYKQYGGYPECGNWHCSECDEIDNRTSAHCPNCGAKMVEPQERSGEE